MIRALAVDVPVRRLVRREAITGLYIGVGLAVAIFPYSLFYEDASIAGTVALAMLAASSVATVLAMVLPWLLNRLGSAKRLGSFDPPARDAAWTDPYDEVPHPAHPRLEFR